MRLITIFSTPTFFYFVGMAWASQPDKVKLYGVSRNAAAAASRTIKMGKVGQPTPKSLVTLVAAPQGRASQLHFHEGHKKSLPALLKVKLEKDPDDPDRRLAKEGSIRGGKMEDSTQRKQSLRDWNTAFEANVAMPVRLQSMMKKTSGDSKRRLQTAECTEQDNGLLACVLENYPWEGAAVVFLDCPVSAPTVFECQSCGIVATADDTLPECNSCTICSDTVAYDCTNLFEGECVTQDCNGNCNSDDTSTEPPTPEVVEISCYLQDNGLGWCVDDDTPIEGFSTYFYNCPPVDGASVTECESCTIVSTADANLPDCQSCSLCSEPSTPPDFTFDCSNILEGDCVAVDCDGYCVNGGDGDTGTDPPTPPNPSTPTPPPDTNPPTSTPGTPPPSAPPIGTAPENTSSSASMRKLGILSIAATAIAAFL